jgi:DNA-binding IclR family transcriptional regulator
LIYIAWADEAETKAWFERAAPPLTKTRRKQINNDLAKIRARGWSASARMHESAPRDPLTVHEVTEREFEMGNLNIAGISAPVFDMSGKMICALALTSFATLLDGEQISEIAAAVKASADRITRQLGGISRVQSGAPS